MNHTTVDWDHPYQPHIRTKLSASGINILWWNIQSGETNRKLISESPDQSSSIDHNLLNLIASADQPDIIILGEYSEGSFKETTREQLKLAYPFHPDNFWPYNPGAPEGGIMLFSRYPFTLIRTQLLDYFPLNMQAAQDVAAYKRIWANNFPQERFYVRTYLNIQIDHPLGQFHLVPFHGLTHLEKQHQNSNGGFFSILKIKLGFVFGSQNPTMFQLQRLRQALENDFGKSLNSEPLLIMGDFNLFRELFGIRSQPYKTISRGLCDPFMDNKVPTWPLPSSREFQKFSVRAQIDHAFASRQFEILETAILPFRGSDHAAIAVKVRLK
jgi:endonuclease/exonuclease/phosphatase family metal-dependent hydrolase